VSIEYGRASRPAILKPGSKALCHRCRGAVAVEVGYSNVARWPLGITECAAHRESPVAVVEEDQLRVRSVVAQHDVEIAILIQIRARRGITSVGGVGERRSGREMALPVAE
jgi:hypothetical protein